jgi:hypothetical protein
MAIFITKLNLEELENLHIDLDKPIKFFRNFEIQYIDSKDVYHKYEIESMILNEDIFFYYLYIEDGAINMVLKYKNKDYEYGNYF